MLQAHGDRGRRSPARRARRSRRRSSPPRWTPAAKPSAATPAKRSNTAATVERPKAPPAPLSAPTPSMPTSMLDDQSGGGEGEQPARAAGARSSAKTAAWLVAGRRALMKPSTITSMSAG